MNLQGKRICVTGGAGFLGSHVVEELRRRGCREISVVRRGDFDLRTWEGLEQMFQTLQPQVLVHLAALVGGIGANRASPGSFFYENAIMDIQLIELARLRKLEKLVLIGTVCAYPKLARTPFREDEIWNGYPEETNAPYGLAKKMLLVQAQAYRQQYGLNSIYLLPTNLYGPRDHFHPQTSHVIPALIRKCEEAVARDEQVINGWGDGSPTRDFLYVGDAARGIVLATEKFEGEQPVNLGTGRETSIADLTRLLCRLTGFRGRVDWDTRSPNGQPRRCLDTTRAAEQFGFRATTSLEEGLQKTIEWYRANHASLPG